MKKLIIIPMFLFLAACQTTQPDLIETKYKVVMPDEKLFHCPLIKKYPNIANLDDIAVAKLLVKFWKVNHICYNSNMAIKKYLTDAQATIEK